MLKDEFHEIFTGDSPLWFPGVARELVSLYEGSEYSTSKYLGMLEGESLLVKGERISIALEFFDGKVPEILACKNNTFLPRSGFGNEDYSLLLNAIELIEKVESLAESIGVLVKSAHLLEVQEPGYDVSFSDPSLPFSIFFNISEGKFEAARIAEAIIHEAMHLQLSLIEISFDLYINSEANFYSPWKNSMRPVSGVLHGLYVFRVILQWLELISDVSSEVGEYSDKRAEEIRGEICKIDFSGVEEFLTKDGALFLKNLC